MTFWVYLRFRLLRWALRQAGRLLLWLVLAAAAPVTLVAAIAYLGTWLRGWPPARLWRAALWALPMTAVYFADLALRAANVQAFALAPARDWQASWHLARAGHPGRPAPPAPASMPPARHSRRLAGNTHRAPPLVHWWKLRPGDASATESGGPLAGAKLPLARRHC